MTPIHYYARSRRPPDPPGPRHASPFPVFAGVRSDVLQVVRDVFREHGDVARLRFAPGNDVETVLDDRVPTAADVPALSYVRMVVQETLRLYPPAAAIVRQVIGEDEIGGYRIRAGSSLLLCSYVTHRHPAFWSDPDAFDPEHFTPEAIATRPRHAFVPFGAGPRVCIGLEMAMLAAVLTVAMVCQRYRFRPVPHRPVEPWVQVLLRPRSGVCMTFSAAHGATRRRFDVARAVASA
jgi:cytochrome P450